MEEQNIIENTKEYYELEVLEGEIQTDENEFELHMTPEYIKIPRKIKQSDIIVSLKPIAIATATALVTMFVVFRDYHQIPLTGEKSLATVVIIVGALSGMINFTYYFTKGKRSESMHESKRIYWRNYPVVLLSYTIILSVFLLFAFKIMGQLFLGATFDIYTSSLIGAVIVGIVNYSMIYTAQTLTPTLLIRSLTFIILGGVSVAMITNKDQQWWLHNFSFLGTPEATNAWQFNLTLMFSALLMIALIDYVFVLLYEQSGKTKRLITLKILLIMTAICLGGVGFFPYNESTFYQSMHNRVAGYLVYLFIVLIIAIRWLLPSVPKQFLKVSYLIGAVLGLSSFLFLGIGYLSLTAFELVAFVLAFSWLLLLLQQMINIVEMEDVIKVRLVKKS